MNNFLSKNNKGFTVVEALVAVSILLLAISGTFAVAQSSLQFSSMVKNKVTAYYLAQDAIEYIRHLRDNNGLEMLENANSDVAPYWLDGFAAGEGSACFTGTPTLPTKTCMVDSSGGSIRIGDGTTNYENPNTCLGGVCPLLYLNNDTERFQYNSGSAKLTSFRRNIQVVPIYYVGTTSQIPINAVIVKVTVSWAQPNSSGVRTSVEVSDLLLNWQQLTSP